MTTEPKTDWGRGDRAVWQVRCSCGATVAEGEGQAPTPSEIERLTEGHTHLAEAGGGVHRLTAVQRGRITEKKRR